MPRKHKSASPVTLIATGVVIFVAAAGGMFLGSKFGSASSEDMPIETDVFTSLKLVEGKTFPTVEVIDYEYHPRQTTKILHPEGTVVLFMDDNCAPCSGVVNHWQRMIDEGVVESDQVLGITFDNAVKIEDFLRKYEITFPVYADEQFTFMGDYGVDGFPLVLVVDKGGIIRYSESDSRKRLDAGRLTDLLTGANVS